MMLDNDANPCQTPEITAPVPEFGIAETCASHGENDRTENRRGRPRITTERPWETQGISRSTYYERLLKAPVTYAEVEPLRWFCVRTSYGDELHADVAIRTAGFDTFFPLLWVAPTASRLTDAGRAVPAKSERLVPLLPRYLLVRFVRTDPSWRAICTMRGVERVFSTHPERPTPIPDKHIEALREGLAPNGVLYPPKKPERGKSAKKRWVDMATALLTMVGADGQ
jgi:transcription antitermination factor NusG